METIARISELQCLFLEDPNARCSGVNALPSGATGSVAGFLRVSTGYSSFSLVDAWDGSLGRHFL